MRFLSLCFVLVFVSNIHAQAPNTVVPFQPKRMLYDYLMEQAREHFAKRQQTIQKLTTPEEIQQRQQFLKRKFVEALGGFPKKTPLNPKVTGKLDRGDYIVENVIYESQPNHHVTANFYYPKKRSGKIPGVLIPCGHSTNGKAADAYQRTAILLAKNGMAALCYDPIGQGERNQLLNNMGRPAIPSSTSEHTMVGVGALLVGKSAATYRIWDGIRSMDYLASRPEVDASKLGCTGNSGGGTLTSYLMALDERIVAAAPSCYLTTLQRLFETIGPQDAEQNITGQVAFGMDHADYVTMRAPKPTLMCVATQDFFDIEGAWATFREAKLLYGKLSHGERVSLFEFNDKHGFSKPRREAAMRWMRRWLLKIDDAPSEGDFPSIPEKDLWCTRSGQVLSDLRGVSAFDLNLMQEKKLAKERAAWQKEHSVDELKSKIHDLIGGKVSLPALQVSVLKEGKRGNFFEQNFRFVPEKGIRLDALLLTPRVLKKDAMPVVYLRESTLPEKEQAVLENLASNGRMVLSLDLRGMGYTSPEKSDRGFPAQFGPDWKEAFLGIHLNRPLLGQRVDELQQMVDWFAKKTNGKIHVMAIGHYGPIALHAAALNSNIGMVTTQNSIISWSDVVRSPITKGQLANVVPGALQYYDLPDLVRLIGEDHVVILDSATPRGDIISTRVPGTVIDYSPAKTRQYIGSPSIAVLEDGTYVASHDFFGPGSTRDRTVVFSSTDKGKSWDRIANLKGQWWSSLFTHRGDLYLMGTSKEYGFTVIRKSTDGGKSWTTPKDENTGLLWGDGKYHCAPVPVVVHNGRIWRAMEDAMGPGGWGTHFRSFMMSAPVDADLLQAKNWTSSNRIGRDEKWLDGKFKGWLEGNAVVTPDGEIVNILRVDNAPKGDTAAIVHISPDGMKATFDPEKDFIDFPGGSVRFTIRYDPKSKYYWTLSNFIPDSQRNPFPARTRNTLALMRSKDLRNWEVRGVVLHHPDQKKHGFQYVDWLFEGPDLIIASRTAYDDAQGGAHNQHDANYMTFHRLENFRTFTNKRLR